VGKFEGRIPLGIPRGRWKDNIQLDLKGMERKGFIWLNKGTGGRLLINTVMNFQVPQSARNFSTS
jgi:hypothetical protein